MTTRKGPEWQEVTQRLGTSEEVLRCSELWLKLSIEERTKLLERLIRSDHRPQGLVMTQLAGIVMIDEFVELTEKVRGPLVWMLTPEGFSIEQYLRRFGTSPRYQR